MSEQIDDFHNHATGHLKDVGVESLWTDSVRNAFRKQAGQSKAQDVYA